MLRNALEGLGLSVGRSKPKPVLLEAALHNLSDDLVRSELNQIASHIDYTESLRLID